MKNKFFIILFLLVSYGTKAQVLFTDFNPDRIVRSYHDSITYLYLDVDQDQQNDFYFHVESFENSGLGYQIQFSLVFATNSSSAFSEHSSGCIVDFNQGDLIDGSLNWGGGTVSQISFLFSQGCSITDLQDRYLPFRMLINGQYCYGWIEMYLVNTPVMRIEVKELAVNLTPNSPITAGQRLTGINEIKSQYEFAVYPNPSLGNFTMKFAENIQSGKITITNLLGEVIFEDVISNENEKHISLPSSAKGIYFVKVEDGKNNAVSKIIID